MPSYIMVVDSGNTLVKWGIHDGHNWLMQGKVTHHDLSTLLPIWQNLSEPSTIIVSQVASDIISKQLSELFSIWTIRPQWITAIPYQCGVNNLYTDPTQLGCDRWAALIAAWDMQTRACLVINVGTAMTIDVLSNSGDFIGGIILPGPDLMLKSLAANTMLPGSDVGVFENFPVSTVNATYSGVIQSLLGAIERMQSLFYTTYGSPYVGDCIVSGGGAPILLPYINFPVKVVDNLVLEGLVIIACDASH